MATTKQEKALEILVESGGTMPVSKAMEKAGYSPATAKTPQKLTNSEAYKALFPVDRTQQVVDNLHKLAISAQDEKIQVEATKVWIERAIPKQEQSGNTINFINNATFKADKYKK